MTSEQGETPPTLLREKTFYVPYQKLLEVFEREGRGLFLPYSEFLELLRKAKLGDAATDASKAPVDYHISGGQFVGTAVDNLVRFEVDYRIETLKDGWTEVPLPFDGIAIESAELDDSSAIFTRTGDKGYALIAPKPGTYGLALKFVTTLHEQPGKKSFAFGLPPIAVSKLRLTIPERGARVELKPGLATTLDRTDSETRVEAFLGATSTLHVDWMPPPGQAAERGAIIIAEQQAAARLDERILQLESLISYRIERGESAEFTVALPADCQLIKVDGNNIRETKTENGELHVLLHEAVKDQYTLRLSFERLFSEAPKSLSVPFPRVLGVLRESGWIVLGHDSALRTRMTTRELSQLDPDEVPKSLRPFLGTGYRYLSQPFELSVAVELIEPVVQASSTSVVVLGEQEDQWVGWIDYDIRKAGLFQLRFAIPKAWVVEEVGDPKSVEEFIVAARESDQLVTVNLRARVIGSYRLPFTLTRDGSAHAGSVTLSPPRADGVTQDQGIFGVSFPKAIEAVTTSRTNIVDIDSEQLFATGVMAHVASAAAIPRAFRYRAQPASVGLTLTAKKTAIDVLAQHLVDIGDSELSYTHWLDYEILYAPVDQLFFSAPSALDDELKVESEQKTEVKKLTSENGRTLWQVGLQPPVLGGVTLTITHGRDLEQMATGATAVSEVPFVRAERVRSARGFIALRKSGTLEIVSSARELETLDPTQLPDKLRRGQIYGAFRYFAAAPGLTLELTRFDFEQLAQTAIPLVHAKTILSEELLAKSRTTLFVKNRGAQYLDLDLPGDAKILSLTVAGQSQSPRRREGSATLIEIPKSNGAEGVFPVVIVYETPVGDGFMDTQGRVSIPTLTVLGEVPVGKVEVDLYLPPQYVYYDWSGSLRHRSTDRPELWLRFKELIGAAASPSARAAARASRISTLGQDLDLPTRGYRHHYLESLASPAFAKFEFVDRRLFWGIDFLMFVLAGGLLFWLGKRQARRRLRSLTIAVVLAVGSYWFFDDTLREVVLSALLGFLLVGVLQALMAFAAAWTNWRESRIRLAPDPFLEDAEPRRRGRRRRAEKREVEDDSDAPTAVENDTAASDDARDEDAATPGDEERS